MACVTLWTFACAPIEQLCRFHPRCPYVMDVCTVEEPKLIEIEGEHQVACHRIADSGLAISD